MAALLAQTELRVDVCRIWRPRGTGGEPELLASAGDADETRHRAPPAPREHGEPNEVPGGIAFGVEVAGGSAVIALYADREIELTPDDLSLLRGIGQALAGSTWGERSAEQLARAERRYRDLIERLPVVSYLAEYGPAGKWLYVSPQIEGLLGFPAEDWLVNSDFWWSRMHPDDRDRVALEEARCAQTLEPLSVEYRMIARDGRTVWIRDEGALGRQGDAGAVRVEGVLTEITERRRVEEELRHLADHDELTGLANRRRFTDELARRRQGSAGAVALVDLDDLKYVNDSLGHAAGDVAATDRRRQRCATRSGPASSWPASAATSSGSCSRPRRRARSGCGWRRCCTWCASSNPGCRRGPARAPSCSNGAPARRTSSS